MCGNHSSASRGLGVLLAVVLVAGLCSCSSQRVKPTEETAAGTALRQRMLLDADWSFHLGDVASSNEVVLASYDDRDWQRVNVPHDYVLEGTYNATNTRNHGYLPYQPAWYRKHFVIPPSAEGKTLQLEFGGIFRNSQVWLNGQFLGSHPSGYVPLHLDITKAARSGADNVIAVRVDPREFEGWWYEGGGIYRHVYFTAVDPLHVATWGTCVISKVPNGEQGADAEAELTIQTTVQNDGAVPAQCSVVSEIIGPDGRPLSAVETAAQVPAAGQNEVVQGAVLQHPRLWSPESPWLYQLRTTIRQGDRPADSTTTAFGIRTITYDPDKADQRNAFNGHCMAVIQADTHPAVFHLTVTSPGLTPASIRFKTQ